MFGNLWNKTPLAMALALSLLAACGAQQDRFNERAKVERITALIDAERYDEVIAWYDSADTTTQKDYSRYYALAKLGQGGFDPINIIPAIMAPQTFKSPQIARLFGDCDNRQLKSLDNPEIKCLVVRVMNQLPNVNDENLREGEAILVKASEEGKLSDSDYTLLLIVETSIVVKSVGNVLEAYLYLGDNISDQRLESFYREIGKAAEASKHWIENMERSPNDISKRITGLEKLSLLKKVKGKTEFLKETGIPFVLENIRAENRDSKAVVSKVLFIQAIDSTLRDNFGIEP